MDTRERFRAKVEESDGCWLWRGSVSRTGYGKFRYQGKLAKAHRVAYELAHGRIPDGLHILHSCDTPGCVRPEHLRLGSHQDNMADMTARKRQPSGVRNAAAKLTDAQVQEIRARYGAGHVTQRELADEYGLTHQGVSCITRGRTWK